MDFPELASLNDGFKHARIVQTACELELFDATREPVEGLALAEELGTSARGTRILCDALVVLGLLDKHEGTYVNTAPADRFLVTDQPTYFGGMCRFDAMNWPVWARLPQAVATGDPQREDRMHQDDPAATRRFMRAMVSIGRARGDTDVLPERVDLTGRRRLLDLGGGPGHFTRAFLQAYEGLEAILFDLPATLAVTRELVRDWGAEAARLSLFEGDYLEDPLPTTDACLISNILHGEPPERCQQLLDRAGEAMEPGGLLVIKEHILGPDRTSPEIAALFAVDMLLMTGGDCYTLEQVTGWLHEAGFEDVRELEPEPPLTSSLVLATKR